MVSIEHLMKAIYFNRNIVQNACGVMAPRRGRAENTIGLMFID